MRLECALPALHQRGNGAPVSVLVYEPDDKTQLRLSGLAHVATEGMAVDEAWRASTNFARRCYMAGQAPGTPVAAPTSGLPESVEGREPHETELAEARRNFALLIVEMRRIDWLYLDQQGHRRARFDWTGDCWDGCWLVP